MRMLKPEEETDDADEVTWEDQQRINNFSKHNSRLSGLEETMEKKKADKEALDDIAMELELADEDDPVIYKVGDAFLHLSLPHAQKLLAADQKQIDAEMDSLTERIDECHRVMKELKIILYAKFKNSINLD